MPRDEITSIRFFSSSYVSGVTHTPTLSIRHSCRKIHTYIRIYFRTIQFRRTSSLKLHLLQRSIDKTRQLYFSIRRLPNFYEATVPLVQVSSNLCGEPVTRYSRERKVSISVPCRKMRGKDRELEVGDERRQCSSFGSRRGEGWPACTVLAREHKGQRMSLDSREQESARRWVTEEGGEAEAVGGWFAWFGPDNAEMMALSRGNAVQRPFPAPPPSSFLPDTPS